MTELEVIEWVRERSRAHSSLLLPIGDDMAIIAAPRQSFLISTDLLLDGVHFDSRHHSMQQIGHKAIARALSDCAAMAVRPVSILISMALPKTLSDKNLLSLLDTMIRTTQTYGAALAGGDTSRWDGPLALDVAVTAEAYEGMEPVRRSGARRGDILYVTGPLGGSIAGHHLSFQPRVPEARQIANQLGGDLHAMIDISDGLALDLWRICRESGVGALLDETLLEEVVSDDARACFTRDGKRPVDHVLSDGEDHELLFAAAPTANLAGLTSFRVGEVIGAGLMIRAVNGEVRALKPKGYVH